ncbi:class I SAM-dependent methyltransferase [Streptomyces sp. NPDC090106]|uniref:class I SAM-dependent methyltransferase n=1 Tax=Streptomyces sp. NPDC090106 TaxID=3365946 RepID=UPI00381CE988
MNQRHPWSHNDHYAPWIADQVCASSARHVLEVGCGTGNLVALLRHRGLIVTALEPAPRMAHAAAKRFADDPAVTIVEAGFAARELRRRFDAVTLVAVLHHLPLTSTLRELRGCLHPGGRLVVVGCYREAGRLDRLVSLLSLLLNPVMGLARQPARVNELPLHMTAPTVDPQETLNEIQVAAAQELPGARIRRRLFWRYSLVYDLPATVLPDCSEGLS